MSKYSHWITPKGKKKCFKKADHSSTSNKKNKIQFDTALKIGFNGIYWFWHLIVKEEYLIYESIWLDLFYIQSIHSIRECWYFLHFLSLFILLYSRIMKRWIGSIGYRNFFFFCSSSSIARILSITFNYYYFSIRQKEWAIPFKSPVYRNKVQVSRNHRDKFIFDLTAQLPYVYRRRCCHWAQNSNDIVFDIYESMWVYWFLCAGWQYI